MSRQQQYLIYHNFPSVDLNPKCYLLPKNNKRPVDDLNHIIDAKLPRTSEMDNLYNMPSSVAKMNCTDIERLSPRLPPCLLESERMQYVKLWINDLQSESDLSLECEAVQSSSSGGSLVTGVQPSQCPGVTNTLSSGLYDFLDQPHSASLPAYLSCQQQRQQHEPPASQQLLVASTRFSAQEIEIIFKIFEDYFRQGICPGLSEVRARLDCSAPAVLTKRRTPQAVRAKIKRLQLSVATSQHQLTLADDHPPSVPAPTCPPIPQFGPASQLMLSNPAAAAVANLLTYMHH